MLFCMVRWCPHVGARLNVCGEHPNASHKNLVTVKKRPELSQYHESKFFTEFSGAR